jgi:hypothetical protein
MDMEVIELKVTLARVLERLESMNRHLEAQDEIIKQQGDQISRLVSLADQGRGSIWVLITAGGFMGVVLSNAKAILQFFSR